MGDPSATHNMTWNTLGEYVNDPQTRLLSDDIRTELAAEWNEIQRLQQSLDDALLIGLIGGTGVGKSTFINALAGKRISRSGDRRPTTDRVVVYRHVETELPDDLPVEDFAQPQVLHQHELLKKIVLFDFPDFDSAERRHESILKRYLDHLDVLLVVVDDEKYADRRLYELLSDLGQSHDNMFVMLNKIDHLQDRYRDKTPQVIDELKQDICRKMEEYAQTTLRPDQLLAISAGQVATARCDGQSTVYLSAFERVETLLGTFQEEKHFAQIKEKNIHVRKSQLAEKLTATALGTENQSIIAETKQLVQQWDSELRNALLAIPTELVVGRERRSLKRTRLRRAGRRLGAPFCWVFSLMETLPWAKGGEKTLQQSELGGRIHQHYRGVFEAVNNLQARFESEFAGAVLAHREAAKPEDRLSKQSSPEVWSTAMAGEALAYIQSHEPPTSRWRRLACHVPAMLAIVLAIWNQVAPLYDSITGEGGNFFVAIARVTIGSLNPMFVLGLVISVVVVYLITSWFLWVREIHQLDGHIGDAEETIRQDIELRTRKALSRLEENVNALDGEFHQVQRLVGQDLPQSVANDGSR